MTVDRDGTINTRLYRKPQKKLITLNYTSHHPHITKEETVSNMFDTAELVSSNQDNKTHSSKMVNELLLNNGYNEEIIKKMKREKSKRRRMATEKQIKIQLLH